MLSFLDVAVSTDAINLIIAAFTLTGIIIGALFGADRLLGRRIERHQSVILASQKTLEVKLNEIVKEVCTMDAYVKQHDDRFGEQAQKIAFIQGQSDTMLKVVELLASIRNTKDEAT